MAWSTRFLAAVAFLAAGVVFAPDTVRLGSSSPAVVVAAAKLAHLLCFATSFGAALWVTFIGGTIMFKNLPRHQFGIHRAKCSQHTSRWCLCVLQHRWQHLPTSAHGRQHPLEKYQLGFLLTALGCNVANLLVFTPMTIEMMKKRHKTEREVSIGEEVGWSKNVEVAKKNPQLAALNKKFGMIHGFSSLANILSFGSLAMHSWYLAGKIQF